MDWETRFQTDDTPWERPGLHPALDHWADLGLLEDGQSIIIPGCGRAREPLELARAGQDVTVADLSETALAWQKEAFEVEGLPAHFEYGNALNFRPPALFDLIWEQTFLCAISPKDREAYEQTAHAWLKPGGHLLALFMQKDERGGPPYGCSIDAMRTLFPETRWEWPQESAFRPFPHPSLNGKPEIAAPLKRL
ncbi:MAG: methyltransferase domain-containing protein [Alphaproteobacteria bacterium]|nr:methyltransferase domain-containing protein [Alphaproteobacteria bacterium]